MNMYMFVCVSCCACTVESTVYITIMLHSFLYIYKYIYKRIYLGLTVLKYNRSYIRAHPTVVEFYKRLGMSQVSANSTAAAQAAYK